MVAQTLNGSNAFVLGAIDPAGRQVAVALAEAGATVSVSTASLDTAEEFFVNSILNEAWSLGRAGAAFLTDGDEIDELRSALELSHHTVLVAMPAVSSQEWPATLAEDAGATFIAVTSEAAGYTLTTASLDKGVIATDEALGAAIARLAEELKA